MVEVFKFGMLLPDNTVKYIYIYATVFIATKQHGFYLAFEEILKNTIANKGGSKYIEKMIDGGDLYFSGSRYTSFVEPVTNPLRFRPYMKNYHPKVDNSLEEYKNESSDAQFKVLVSCVYFPKTGQLAAFYNTRAAGIRIIAKYKPIKHQDILFNQMAVGTFRTYLEKNMYINPKYKIKLSPNLYRPGDILVFESKNFIDLNVYLITSVKPITSSSYAASIEMIKMNIYSSNNEVVEMRQSSEVVKLTLRRATTSSGYPMVLSSPYFKLFNRKRSYFAIYRAKSMRKSQLHELEDDGGIWHEHPIKTNRWNHR